MVFTAHAQQLTFTTLAGPSGGPGSADGTGSAARFSYPTGVATDSGGNVYVTDSFSNTVRKITPAGLVTTLAGLERVNGSADGTGSAARFKLLAGVATDGGGNVYVADLENNAIRKITPSGIVTTLAGGLHGSADGTGSAARFAGPKGVATDGSGNVYVADSSNETIRKITPAGVVTTLAGSAGLFGSADGTGSTARFALPVGVATDSGGNVYVADGANGTIRKITPAGVVTTLAGSAGLRGSTDGTGSTARFSDLAGMATDSGGNVYAADNGTIRKITPAGLVTTLAGSADLKGSADGTGSEARFADPWGVATDSRGSIYVGDRANNTIRKITPSGVVTTLAGAAVPSGSADGTGSAARFGGPFFGGLFGIAPDSNGNVYVADASNETIRKITPAGVVTTLAGSAGLFGSADGTGSAARFHDLAGVATDSSGNIYVADNGTIRKITSAGVVTTLAGSAGRFGSTDGTGSAARFFGPAGVATDSGGNIYVADFGNKTIRKITAAGVVTTLAGSAGLNGSADGTGGEARFAGPTGMATDSGGNVYVADILKQTIRKITAAGVVTTLAGSAGILGSADGVGSAARFWGPTGLASDSSGNVYVADRDNRTIRKITPAGVVTTLAGSAGVNGNADGTGGVARFVSPVGVAVDSSGNVYVADSDSHSIRLGRPALPDTAVIDSPTGIVGTTRQLSTSTQTATSWRWTLIRQPAASAARLSSASVRNPRFTPDVADLYIFQLTASKGEKTSIATVSLMATATAPTKP